MIKELFIDEFTEPQGFTRGKLLKRKYYINKDFGNFKIAGNLMICDHCGEPNNYMQGSKTYWVEDVMRNYREFWYCKDCKGALC